MWKSYFSQLLNVHSVSDIRQLDIHNSWAINTWSQSSWGWNCKAEKV
jgi:hypothetical protein